jgi:hypothetical protein
VYARTRSSTIATTSIPQAHPKIKVHLLNKAGRNQSLPGSGNWLPRINEPFEVPTMSLEKQWLFILSKYCSGFEDIGRHTTCWKRSHFAILANWVA